MLRNIRFCNEKCSKKKRFCFEKSSFRIRTWSFFIYDRQLRISCNSLFNDDRLIFHPYCKLFEQEFEQRKKESILNTTFIFVIFTRVSTVNFQRLHAHVYLAATRNCSSFIRIEVHQIPSITGHDRKRFYLSYVGKSK